MVCKEELAEKPGLLQRGSNASRLKELWDELLQVLASVAAADCM